jgi:hypothetical protein
METDLDEDCVGHDQDLLALSELKMKGITMSPLPISAAQAKNFVLTSTH